VPQRWVVRRDLQGHPEHEPLRCYVDNAVIAEPGLRTVAQCIAELLRENEECIGEGDHRLVHRDGTLMAHIDVTREKPTS